MHGGASLEMAIYHRSDLKAGHQGGGPCIISTGESTNFVPPQWSWRIDAVGSLLLARAPYAH
jgi:N-methylhydantoinase A